jgi:hypothetical protein
VVVTEYSACIGVRQGYVRGMFAVGLLRNDHHHGGNPALGAVEPTALLVGV